MDIEVRGDAPVCTTINFLLDTLAEVPGLDDAEVQTLRYYLVNDCIKIAEAVKH